MKQGRKRRFFRRLVLGLAVTMIAAPAAQAGVNRGIGDTAQTSWYLGEGVLNALPKSQVDVARQARAAASARLGNQRQVENAQQKVTLPGHLQDLQALQRGQVSPAGYGGKCYGIHPSHPAMARCLGLDSPSTISVDRKADYVTPSDLPGGGMIADSAEFSWRDAGFGAVTVLALLLVAAGGAGAVRSRRKAQTA